MRFRCSGEQAITQSRICVDAYLRLGGSAAFQRKRAAPVFVTGWKPRVNWTPFVGPRGVEFKV